MRMFKTMALASLAVLAVAGTAAAQGEGTLVKPDTIMVVGPDGRLMTMTMSDKVVWDDMRKNAREMTGSQMYMMSGGKMYVMDDRRMPDGRMMSDHLRPAR